MNMFLKRDSLVGSSTDMLSPTASVVSPSTKMASSTTRFRLSHLNRTESSTRIASLPCRGAWLEKAGMQSKWHPVCESPNQNPNSRIQHHVREHSLRLRYPEDYPAPRGRWGRYSVGQWLRAVRPSVAAHSEAGREPHSDASSAQLCACQE